MDNKPKTWEFKPGAWQQGWLCYDNNPWIYDNPYERDTPEYEQFEQGWLDARFMIGLQNES